MRSCISKFRIATLLHMSKFKNSKDTLMIFVRPLLIVSLIALHPSASERPFMAWLAATTLHNRFVHSVET